MTSEKTEVITLVSSWKDGGKIYKGAGGSGGHQPFLYGIRSLSIKRNGSRLLISTTLNQGSTFRLNFAPKESSHLCQSERSKRKRKMTNPKRKGNATNFSFLALLATCQFPYYRATKNPCPTTL